MAIWRWISLALWMSFGQAVALQLEGLSTTIAVNGSALLNVTSLSTKADNTSALECWQLTTPFSSSSGAGTVGALILQLANVTNVTYTILPARFNGGLHVAPYKQLVVFLTGLIHITLPNSTDDAWISGGTTQSVIIATDTTGIGHISTYPSNHSTLALQIPFAQGPPPYRVLNSGPCLL
jgi:hypothetical protein